MKIMNTNKMKRLLILSLLAIASVAFAQLPNIWFPATGTDTYSANITNFGTNYTNKIAFVKFTNTNTGASTININSLGAVPLRMWDGDSWEGLTVGQISTTIVYKITHTGSYFTMFGTGSSGGGTWGSITGTLSNQTDLQSALNAKQNTLTLGNLTTSTTGVSVTGGTGAVIGTGAAISIQNATTSQTGLLTNTDWNTFNGKQAGDADLTTIAGLTATTDNFIVSVASAWASRTPAQVKTTLSLNNVENTALSTWAGSSNITTTGALTSGSTGAGFTVALATSTISGALPVANLTAKYILDQATPSTAGSTITLDCNSQIQRSHVGSATFSAPKTLALSNTTNAMFFNFIFEVTNVAAVLTVPSDWLMSTDDFDGADWIPPATGKYELGGSFDDVNNVWYVKISGPFN